MKFSCPALLIFVYGFLALPIPNPHTGNATPEIQDPNAPSANSKVVYVSDFELDVARRRTQKNPASPATSSSSSSSESSDTAAATSRTSSTSGAGDSSSKNPRASSNAKPADSDAEDVPAERANALLAAISDNLVKALEKAGYTVRRVRSGETAPHAGLRIRGVFAEPDEQNRIRRLLVGGDSTASKMLLYVGVDNLARPEQPLYELAKPPSNDARHGPVITVTSYSPVVRFEMDKNPEAEDFKKIATDIVADLNALLNANPTMASQ